MKSLYFIRHGESLANAGGAPLPNADIPLTDIGHQQAVHRLHRWQTLGVIPSRIYHSDMYRTKQTALPFCEYYGITATPLGLLNELNTLAFEHIKNIGTDARRQMNTHWWQTTELDHKDGIGADSFGEFLDRVDRFINQLDKFDHQTLIFGHGIWLGLLAYRLMGLPVCNNSDIQRFRQYQTSLPMHNTALYRLDVKDTLKHLIWID